MSFLSICRIFTGILFGPDFLLGLSRVIRFSTSTGSHSYTAKVDLLGLRR